MGVMNDLYVLSSFYFCQEIQLQVKTTKLGDHYNWFGPKIEQPKKSKSKLNRKANCLIKPKILLLGTNPIAILGLGFNRSWYNNQYDQLFDHQ